MSQFYWYDNALCSGNTGGAATCLLSSAVDRPLLTRHQPYWAMLINHSDSAVSHSHPSPTTARAVSCMIQQPPVATTNNTKCSLSPYSAIEKAEFEISEKMEKLNAGLWRAGGSDCDSEANDEEQDDVVHDDYLAEDADETLKLQSLVLSELSSDNTHEKTMTPTSQQSSTKIQRPKTLYLKTDSRESSESVDTKSNTFTELKKNFSLPKCSVSNQKRATPDLSHHTIHAQLRANAKSLRTDVKTRRRQSCPDGVKQHKSFPASDTFDGIDVYNMQVDMSDIVWDVIEEHNEMKKQQDRRRRTDRDLIRRRLASDTTDLYDLARPLAAGGGATCSTNNTTSGDSCSLGSSGGGGGSLHPRLRAGQNLQICFMNETVSDCEEESGDGPVTGDCDATQSAPQSSGAAGQVASQLSTIAAQPHAAAAATAATPSAVQQVALPVTAADFAGYHLQLRNHVQLQLAEGQLAVEQQLRQLATEQSSPTAQVVRTALDKIGADVSKTRRRVNRSLLSELNVAQLQIFANDFHTRIEELNSVLVAGLMERDESLMERDSRLVHIDDLNSYYDQKQQQQQLQQRKQSPLVECRPMASDRAVITPLTPSRSKSLLHSLVQKVVK